MQFRDVALTGSFLAAFLLARWLGYRTLAVLLPFCFMGGVFGWRLWKHYRRGEPLEGVKSHWFIVVLSALMIVLLPSLDRIFDWLSAD